MLFLKNLYQKLFSSKSNSSFLDIDLNSIGPKYPDLKNHPACPKYVAIQNSSRYLNEKASGVFLFQTADLLDYLKSSDYSRTGEYSSHFISWIEGFDKELDAIYPLSPDTIHFAGLAYFINHRMEQNLSLDCYCPECNKIYNDKELEYSTQSGHWVVNFAKCPNGHIVFSVETMHFHFKDGFSPSYKTRVFKKRIPA